MSKPSLDEQIALLVAAIQGAVPPFSSAVGDSWKQLSALLAGAKTATVNGTAYTAAECLAEARKLELAPFVAAVRAEVLPDLQFAALMSLAANLRSGETVRIDGDTDATASSRP
jgi:hypothetical protein